MTKLLNWLSALGCKHEFIRKHEIVEGTDGIQRFYVKCIHCGYESDGIETGMKGGFYGGTQITATV